MKMTYEAKAKASVSTVEFAIQRIFDDPGDHVIVTIDTEDGLTTIVGQRSIGLGPNGGYITVVRPKGVHRYRLEWGSLYMEWFQVNRQRG